MDTIPIQDLVDYTEDLIAKQLGDYLLAQAVILQPWLGALLVNPFARAAIEWGVNTSIEFLDGKAFNLNMDILTSDQAKDYRKAVAAIRRAPPDISNEDWIKLEADANHLFGQLGSISK